MSNGLAISGVTAVLQYYLHELYAEPGSPFTSAVNVSCLAPDLVQHSFQHNGPEPENQVNLFMHQVMHNAAWRNVDLPSLAADGKTRQTSPPLALNLHYLLTVYATDYWQAEALLGYALMMLHENPVLTRNDISNALQALSTAPEPYPGNPLTPFLGSSGLANQVEMIKITPETLGREEMAWLWTALKADYRPTYPFQVSVVLMQPQRQTTAALPVLRRRVRAQPSLVSPLPTLSEVSPPNDQPAAVLGDIVTVAGTTLTGASSALLVNAPLGIQQAISPLSNVGAASFQLTVPNPNLPPPQPNPTDLPAGVYLLTAQVLAGANIVNTNGLPLAVAPRISPAWAPGVLASGSAVTVTVPCSPYLRPGQQASLLIGDQQAPADPITTPTNSPAFTFPILQPTGGVVPVRIRVDGIDSPIIDMTQSPPVFTGPSVQVT